MVVKTIYQKKKGCSSQKTNKCQVGEKQQRSAVGRKKRRGKWESSQRKSVFEEKETMARSQYSRRIGASLAIC